MVYVTALIYVWLLGNVIDVVQNVQDTEIASLFRSIHVYCTA